MAEKLKMNDDYFGLCPVCHKTDGYTNAGRSHRFYCKEHKTSWLVGSNIFSTWRYETEEEQRRKWNEIGLNDFQDVEPYFHPRNEAMESPCPNEHPAATPISKAEAEAVFPISDEEGPAKP